VVWSETQNVRWKVEIPGEGHATPIVWEDQVFVLSAIKTDRRVENLAPPTKEPPGGYRTDRPRDYYQFVVHALDRQTGQLKWRRVAREALPHEGRHETNSYASASPSTDGERLYVSFGSHGLYCYDLQGALLWERDLGDMLTRLGWGEGASPVVYGDHLIVNWDHEGESFITVLDPRTGEPKWHRERDEVTSWATPRVIEYQGITQLVVPATRRIVSYDLATGEELWQCGNLTSNVIPSPVVYRDLVICMSGHRGTEAVAVRLDARGDVTEDARHVAWRLSRDTPYVPSPLLYGDLLYFTKNNNAVVTCVNPASGEVLQTAERLPQLRNMYASPVAAAGRVYFTSREGTTLVAKHEAELQVLAVNQLDEGIDASAAIAGQDLFLRGARHLYCLTQQ
jgi:outer membrane protein assembly factor BamB